MIFVFEIIILSILVCIQRPVREQYVLLQVFFYGEWGSYIAIKKINGGWYIWSISYMLIIKTLSG